MKETTKRRKERQFLHLLKEAIDQSSLSVLLTTANLDYPNPKILYSNNAFTEMTGFTNQELVGKTPRILQGSKTDPRTLNQLKKNLIEGGPATGATTNYRKDGTEYFVEWDVSPVKNSANQTTHYLSIQKDVSKKFEAEAEREEFLGVVTHELKTPLTTIMGFVQLMQTSISQKKEKKKLLDYLSIIELETRRINGLLKDLIDYNKINNNNLITNYELCDFDDLLFQVIKKFRRVVPTHKIYRRGKIKEKLTLDSIRINQVLVNLLSNAVKYSPNANKIIVTLERKESRALVSVQDFGIGIPENKQEEIFQRYFRVNQQDEHSIKSSGLGLFIASEIIKDHKGEIGVISKEGLGSTFYFTLPIARHQSA